MTISASSVRFDEHSMWVEFTDGRTLSVPLAWFPKLLKATLSQRDKVEISRAGLHWDEIDEDISIAGLLAGRGEVTHRPENMQRRVEYPRRNERVTVHQVGRIRR